MPSIIAPQNNKKTREIRYFALYFYNPNPNPDQNQTHVSRYSQGKKWVLRDSNNTVYRSKA